MAEEKTVLVNGKEEIVPQSRLEALVLLLGEVVAEKSSNAAGYTTEQINHLLEQKADKSENSDIKTAIAELRRDTVPVYLTQEEYDALEDKKGFYAIYEESPADNAGTEKQSESAAARIARRLSDESD